MHAPNLSWVSCFGGLPLQEDCHTFLYPSVGMLPGTSYKLHSSEAERPASSLSIDLLGDSNFVIERLFGVFIGVLVPHR